MLDICIVASFSFIHSAFSISTTYTDLLDEDAGVLTAEGRIQRFGQYDHLRVFGMNADRFLTEAGFAVEKIDGRTYPEKILPVVGPADYDINLLFCCRKDQTRKP